MAFYILGILSPQVLAFLANMYYKQHLSMVENMVLLVNLPHTCNTSEYHCKKNNLKFPTVVTIVLL